MFVSIGHSKFIWEHKINLEAEPAQPATLIVGGLVADGTGAPVVALDVLISDGHIMALEAPGEITAREGWRTIRMDGQILAPGFIDVHSHADMSPLLREDDISKIMQGVTTEVVGNCGASLAPITLGHEPLAEDLVSRFFPKISTEWHSFGDLMSTLDAAGYVTNYVPLVGHGMIRAAVMGTEARAATREEVEKMKTLLVQSLSEGAFGMSSGLIYAPGVFSDADELAELATVLPTTGVYATHMRNESDSLMTSIEEAVAVGEQSGCRVQVSHLKAGGRPNWGRSMQALQRLDEARAAGVRISQDLYPYIAASTTMTACLPPWAHEGGPEQLLERLEDPTALERMRNDIEREASPDWENLIRGATYEGIVVANTQSHNFEGQSLAEIADELGVDCFDAMVSILRQEDMNVHMIEFSMQEADVEAIMTDPWTMIGSDGLPFTGEGRPHPRLHGTFPRVLGEYVRNRGVIDLPTAIHKMSGMPAEVFGIANRGQIAIGAVADLVAFSFEEISDVGGYEDPTHTPVGIKWVMQNGRIVVQDGRWLGVRSGKRLTPSTRN